MTLLKELLSEAKADISKLFNGNSKANKIIVDEFLDSFNKKYKAKLSKFIWNVTRDPQVDHMYLLLGADQANKQAILYLFDRKEQDPESFSEIQQNLKRNGLSDLARAVEDFKELDEYS